MPRITEANQLPIVLTTKDVMSLYGYKTRNSALRIIKQAESEGLKILWRGKVPKINRDQFLAWMRGELETKK